MTITYSSTNNYFTFWRTGVEGSRQLYSKGSVSYPPNAVMLYLYAMETE